MKSFQLLDHEIVFFFSLLMIVEPNFVWMPWDELFSHISVDFIQSSFALHSFEGKAADFTSDSSSLIGQFDE